MICLDTVMNKFQWTDSIYLFIYKNAAKINYEIKLTQKSIGKL